MKQAFILIIAGTFLFAACDSTETPDVTADYGTLLENTGNNVIVATYANLAEKTDVLHTAVQTLADNPTAANLDAARAAWSAARSPWEQSEGFFIWSG